jgi:hypothetical protein
MRTFLSALPLIGCAVMTWGCARMMSRRSATTAQASPEEVGQLKDEVAALRAELANSTESAPTEGPKV